LKRISAILLVSALLCRPFSLAGQDLVRVNKVAGVCYASDKVIRVSVPPPEEFYKKGEGKGANITVYYTGFTSAAKAAYQYAVSILASVLPDNASFTVKASWAPIADKTVLGSTSIPLYYGGAYINALNPKVYYPVALAEKISGTSLNSDSEGDIVMTINSSIGNTWYYGTDAKPTPGKYDLVTVVLHELIHGIGFVDSFNWENSVGSYGLEGIPVVYDSFIENENGYLLIDKTKFANNSAALGTELVSNMINFSGPLLKASSFGQKAKIYAPETFDAGSSISHLNEITYTAPDNAALLTPFLGKQEAIHSPGTVILSMLGDVGWIDTRIGHKPFTDTEKNYTSLTFKASVTSDTTYNRDNVGLVYSFNNSPVKDTLFLVPPAAEGDSFKIDLAIPSYNTAISYYFFVPDRFGRVYRLPSAGEVSPYKFFIGTDTVKPIILHTPVDYLLDKTPSIKITARASDNIAIDTVYLEYRKNTGVIKYLGMTNDSLDIYSCTLDIKSMSLVKGDYINYRIVAKDKSASGNKGYVPSASSYYTIRFEETYGVVEGYATDFTNASADFIVNGFSVTKPDLFQSAGLHTRHPYESPDQDNASIEYTSTLRFPIKIDETGLVISFNEVVLVEPGETGSVYGSDDFFDYVVVEGSKDFGLTWFALADGYDSRISSTFLTAYNSAITGNNSTYVGRQDMAQPHTIDRRLFDKYNKGDTLFIRFRLFSDPYAHGWGWSIDDLSIKSVAAGTDDVDIPGFRLFPNPGNGIMRIITDEQAGKELSYDVINLNGVSVRKGTISGGNENIIDIADQPPGLYIILMKNGKTLKSARYAKLR